MDTGWHMQNQMDNLIQSGIDQKDHEWELLEKSITEYVKDCGYTWRIEDIIEQYHKKKDGYYISFTAKDVVSKFETELDKFF